MEEDVLEVKFTLGDGEEKTIHAKEVGEFEREEIEKGTMGIIVLVNGQMNYCEIQDADLDGISFRIEGMKHTMHFEDNVIQTLLVEVEVEENEEV